MMDFLRRWLREEIEILPATLVTLALTLLWLGWLGTLAAIFTWSRVAP